MLLYMLVDLSERSPNGNSCQEMTKQVNRCILNILENSNSRHLLEILFMLAKRHIELNFSAKLVHIIIKCIAKTVRYTDFTVDLRDNIAYIY